MNIENYIESQYRELLSCSQINAEYSDLYKSFRNQKLREILMTLHHDLVGLFRTMNERLPTGEHEAHFWAEPSRDLIKRIEIIFSLVSSLKETPLAFQIDPYYLDLLTRCRDFLSSSGGSSLLVTFMMTGVMIALSGNVKWKGLTDNEEEFIKENAVFTKCHACLRHLNDHIPHPDFRAAARSIRRSRPAEEGSKGEHVSERVRARNYFGQKGKHSGHVRGAGGKKNIQ